MSKKRNKENIEVNTSRSETSADGVSQLKTITDSLVDKGVKHVLAFGLHENGMLELATSFQSYEEIHSMLNRSLFEINKAHAEAINQANKPKEEVN